MSHPLSWFVRFGKSQTGQTHKESFLRLVGCLLLLSGFALALAALVLLATLAQRVAFVAAGLAVELLGLALLTQGYRAIQKDSR